MWPWLISRFFVPLIAAALVLVTRWGAQNLVYYIALPAFFALYRVHSVQKEQPACRRRFKRHPDYARFRRAIVTWQTIEAFALILLMIFEATIAGIAESRARTAFPYAIAIGGFLLPYCVLTIIARRYLSRAHEIVHAADAAYDLDHPFHHRLASS